MIFFEKIISSPLFIRETIVGNQSPKFIVLIFADLLKTCEVRWRYAMSVSRSSRLAINFEFGGVRKNTKKIPFCLSLKYKKDYIWKVWKKEMQIDVSQLILRFNEKKLETSLTTLMRIIVTLLGQKAYLNMRSRSIMRTNSARRCIKCQKHLS